MVILATVTTVAHRASSKWTRYFTSCTRMAAMVFAQSVIASADDGCVPTLMIRYCHRPFGQKVFYSERAVASPLCHGSFSASCRTCGSGSDQPGAHAPGCGQRDWPRPAHQGAHLGKLHFPPDEARQLGRQVVQQSRVTRHTSPGPARSADEKRPAPPRTHT